MAAEKCTSVEADFATERRKKRAFRAFTLSLLGLELGWLGALAYAAYVLLFS